MIRAAWQARIERPVEEVFDYVADLKNEPEWNPDASNVVQVTPGAVALGTVWEEDFARVGHYVTTIDRYEPPRELGFDARNRKTDALVRFHFAPAADGSAATEVACDVTLTMHSVMRLMEPLIRSVAKRGIESSRGPTLKAALERRP